MPIVNLYDNNHTGSVAQITFTSNLGGAPYVIGTFQIPYAFDSNILPGGYYFGTYSLFYSQWGQTCTIQILPPDSPTPTPTNTQTPTQTPTMTPTNTETPTNTPTQTPTKTPNQSPDPTQTQTPTPSITPTYTPTQTQTPTNTNTTTNTNTPTTTQTPTKTPDACCAPIITNVTRGASCTTVSIDFTLASCLSNCNSMSVEWAPTPTGAWTFITGKANCASPFNFTFTTVPATTYYFRLKTQCDNLQTTISNVYSSCVNCNTYQAQNISGSLPVTIVYTECSACTQSNQVLSPNQIVNVPCAKVGSTGFIGGPGQGSAVFTITSPCGNCDCNIIISAVKIF